MNNEIHNGMDIIDSRDIIARIEELTADRDSLHERITEAIEARYLTDIDRDANVSLDFAEWDNMDGVELRALEALTEDAGGTSDWDYGATLIRDSYFKEYAEELANAIDSRQLWPACCIDWEEATEQDYTRIEFDGVDYWLHD
jgi:hypothetical protein